MIGIQGFLCFDEYDVSAKSGDSEALRIVDMLEGGQNQAEVAQAIEVSPSVISSSDIQL